MNATQRIIKNTLLLLISGVISQLISFTAVVYLARALGPDNFGKISFAATIILYFTILANSGLPLLGTREIARERKNINEYFNNILILRACLAAFSFVLLLGFLLLLNKSYEVKLLILLYGIGLLFSPLLIDWVFQGIEKMGYIALGRIFSAVSFAMLIFLFIKRPDQLFLVPCFQIAGSLAASLILVSVFLKDFGRISFKADLDFCKNLLKQALPFGISIGLIQVIYSIDTVMLGFMRSDAEIGYYNAAYKIILPLIMVGAIYFDAAFPVISSYYKTSFGSLIRLQTYNARLMAIVALPMAIGGSFLAMPFMTFIYGPRYDSAANALRILILAAALIYMNMIYARGLWACDKQHAYMKIVFGQAIVNIGLNLVLIPYFGILGASISTLCAELCGFFFYYHEFTKIVHIPPLRHIYRPLIASLLMVPFLTLGKNLNILLVIAICMVIYFCSLYLIKGITKEDMGGLRAALVLGT